MARRYCGSVNLFDALIVVLVLAATLIGISSGAIPQVAGLLGAFVGGALAIAVLPAIEPLVQRVDTQSRSIVVLVGILIVVGIGEAIGSAFGRIASFRLCGSPLSTVDRTR